MRRVFRSDKESYDDYERENFEKSERANGFDRDYDSRGYGVTQDRYRSERDADAETRYGAREYRSEPPRYQENVRDSARERESYEPDRRHDTPFRDRAKQERAEERKPAYPESETAVEKSANAGTNNVVVSYPKTYGDIQHLIDNLRKMQAVIIDIAKIDPRDAQRILDFLSGAIYALGGSQQRIAESIYLLTPGGISIKIPYELKEKLERGKK